MEKKEIEIDNKSKIEAMNILTSGNVNFSTKGNAEDREGYSIMIRWSIQQEDNNPKCMCIKQEMGKNMKHV